MGGNLLFLPGCGPGEVAGERQGQPMLKGAPDLGSAAMLWDQPGLNRHSLG